MAILTDLAITRRAQAILHEKMNFVMTVNRQYDSSFAQKGAKKGTQLKIRLPNEYVTREGANYSAQGHEEAAETLVVATQRGVDSEISSLDLTMSMDDFEQRVLEPQMSTLASIVEADCLNMTHDVANCVGTPGTTPGSVAGSALLPWLQAGQRLDEALAPTPHVAQINGDASTYTINGLTSLYNDQRTLSKQFTEGFLLRNSGIDYYRNNRIKRITTGTLTTAQAAVVNGNGQGGDGSIILSNAGNALTLKKGQRFSIGSVNDIHQETKESYGRERQFVVTADAVASAGGAITVYFAPAIVATGAKQNVSAAPVTGAAITIPGAASTTYPVNLAYHRDAFAVVFADLEMPKGMDMAKQVNIDGTMPLRFIRWYDGNTDIWKSRFDVLYGYKTIRRQLATGIWG